MKPSNNFASKVKRFKDDIPDHKKNPAIGPGAYYRSEGWIK
jgi:hypothetical protein